MPTRRPGVLTAPRMSEKQFQASVVEMARRLGWLVYHTWRSDHSPKGFPDLVMLRGDRMIVAELKIPPNRTTKDQEKWLAAFRGVSEWVFVFTPDDWEDIAKILQ